MYSSEQKTFVAQIDLELGHADTNESIHLSDNTDQLGIENTQEVFEARARDKAEKRRIIRRQLSHVGFILVINVGLPLVIYYTFKLFTSRIVALICSGIPPLLHALYVAIRFRRIDFLSCICVFAFVLSAILSVITGDIRIGLLRDSFTTLVIGLAFLLTLVPLRSRWFRIYPFVHLVSQQMYAEADPVTWVDEHHQDHALRWPDWLWEYVHRYRVFCYILSALWGIGLTLDFAAKVIMIYTNVSPDHVVLFGNVIIGCLAGILTIVSTVSVIRMRPYINRAMDEWRAIHDNSPSDRGNQ